MSWRVARSLDNLLAEINEAAPGRSKASDGSIGDPAHSSRVSDHNPNAAGVVRARDFTHDPDGGLDCNRLATYLTGLLGEHPALASGAYVIWNRRIFSRDRIDEGWRTYTGSNPHDHHLHLSVAYSATGYDSPTPWGWATEEDPMADYAAQLDSIESKIEALAAAEAKRAKATKERDRRLAKGIRVTARDLAAETRAQLTAIADELEAG